MHNPQAWLLLFFLGILLIIIGFTGKLGMVFAVAFTPRLLTVNDGSNSSSSYQAPFIGQQAPGGAYPPGTPFGGVPK